MTVLITRDLLFCVYVKAPDVWKASYAVDPKEQDRKAKFEDLVWISGSLDGSNP